MTSKALQKKHHVQ